MKKAIFALLMFGLVAYSPAPIIDPRKGMKPQAEHTEEQLQQQQKFVGTTGVVGEVPRDTEPNYGDYGQADPGAADVLKNAGSQKKLSEDEKKAQEALRAATSDLKTANKSSMLLWIAVLAGVLGFGVVAGLRAWANKAIPVADQKRYRL